MVASVIWRPRPLSTEPTFNLIVLVLASPGNKLASASACRQIRSHLARMCLGGIRNRRADRNTMADLACTKCHRKTVKSTTLTISIVHYECAACGNRHHRVRTVFGPATRLGSQPKTCIEPCNCTSLCNVAPNISVHRCDRADAHRRLPGEASDGRAAPVVVVVAVAADAAMGARVARPLATEES
jgi:hypothetical protein